MAQRTDALCARLNPGLVAFAITLMLFLAMLWITRYAEISKTDYRAVAAAAGIVE